MAKKSKRYRKAAADLDRKTTHSPEEAIRVVKERASTKFDETVELHLSTSLDPRKSEEQIRGVATLPHGTGRTVRIVVFAGPDGIPVAEAAGADEVGGEELAERIQQGWTDFDVVLATPDMMRVVGRLGRILGPRGMMPSPKAGTIVNADQLGAIIEETRKGRVEYRVDRTAGIHCGIGKASFEPHMLHENMATIMSAMVRAKPSTVKGIFIKNVALASTMGPGVSVDVNQAMQMQGDG